MVVGGREGRGKGGREKKRALYWSLGNRSPSRAISEVQNGGSSLGLWIGR